MMSFSLLLSLCLYVISFMFLTFPFLPFYPCLACLIFYFQYVSSFNWPSTVFVSISLFVCLHSPQFLHCLIVFVCFWFDERSAAAACNDRHEHANESDLTADETRRPLNGLAWKIFQNKKFNFKLFNLKQTFFWGSFSTVSFFPF